MLTVTLTQTMEPKIGAVVCGCYYLFFFLYEFFRIIVNDIFCWKEDRYFQRQEDEYFISDEKIMKSYTVCLRKIKQDDEAAIDNLDKQYILYVQNYKKLKIEKENKDHSCIFKIESKT